MKVFVVGATGRVGQALVSDLVNQGYDVYASGRTVSSIQFPKEVKLITLDLNAKQAEITHVLRGMDVVYFVAGSRGKELLKVDLDGAIKVMNGAENAGVKRFIQLSSAYALEPERWQDDALKEYNIAKFYSDYWLIHQSNLNYTILQPGILTEGAGTGKINLNPDNVRSNSISDVAETLAQILEYPNTIGQVIIMESGTKPISTALSAIH